jgi:CheY-like chemotaxis protein
VSLVGNLEDLPVADILQLVNLSRRTGLLRLRVPAGQVWLAFRDGRIGAAGTPSRSGRIDDLLVGHGLMDRGRAAAALADFPVDGSIDPGDFLIGRGAVAEPRLRQAQRSELQAAIGELFTYSSGNFSFELAEEEFLLRNARRSGRWIYPDGVSPQQMLLEATRQVDEAMQGLEAPQEEAAEPQEPAERGDPGLPAEVEAPEGVRPGLVPGPGEGPPVGPVRRRPSVGRTPNAAAALGGHPGAVPILVVDDEALYRSRLAAEFERAGHPVATAGGSVEAVDICRDWCEAGAKPVVVVDLLMPDREGHGFLGGIELVHLLAQAGLEARVIGLCCGRHDEYRREMHGSGIETLVSKPDLTATPLAALPAAVQDLANTLLWQIQHGARAGVADPNDPLAGLEPGGAGGSAGSRRVTDPLAFLRGLLGELRPPENPSDVWILVLRVASEMVERAVLLVRRRQKLVAFGGFGPTGDGGGVEARVKGLAFGLSENPLLAAVISDRAGRAGLLENEPAAARISSALGDLQPTQFAVMPLAAGGQVVAILYADNASGGAPLADLRSLEIFLSHLGLSLENVALQQRVAVSDVKA